MANYKIIGEKALTKEIELFKAHCKECCNLNFYLFIGSSAGDSIVIIDGIEVIVPANATIYGTFEDDISDITTNNLKEIHIWGDVSLTIGARGTDNETVEEVEIRFSEGFSRSWEKMCWHLHVLTTAVLTGGRPTSCYCAFQYCYALRAVNLSDVDFSACETMQGMFRDDTSLETLDVSTWDFRACTTMMRMCCGCTSLTTVVGFCNKDCRACTSTQGMFSGCTSLRQLAFTGNDFSSVTTASQMFSNCSGIDFSAVDFSWCTIARYMFSGCSGCTFDGCDFSSVTDAQYMFNGCSGCTFDDCDFSSVTDAQHMFNGCSGCTFDGCDFSSVTDAQYMFNGCSGCTFDGCDFSSVTNATQMFGGGDSEHPVIVNNCDFRSLTSIYALFFGGTLYVNPYDTTVVCSNCNFSGANSTNYMFSNIAHVDCHGCDFSNVTDVSYMFNEEDIFTMLSFTDNDLSSVSDASYMCYGAAELVSADFTGCDFSSVTNATQMFYGCSVLATLLFGTWDMSTLSAVGNMFDNCPLLTTVAGSLSNLRYSLDMGSSPLSRDSALVFIHALSAAAAEETPTLTLSSSTVSLLTDDDIAIATDKGWTISA